MLKDEFQILDSKWLKRQNQTINVTDYKEG